jgi:tetratricopeptide (TPR) repeat protein
MRTRTRAARTAATILTFLVTGSSLRAQNADVDEVKRVIRAETETYYQRDADGWKRTWVQDSTAIRTFITSGSYSVALGWDRFGRGTVESLRKDPTPQAVQIDRSNYVVRIDGALAWAEFDERTTFRDGRAPLAARQQRTLVKSNGEWRILSAGSFVGSTYGASPDAVESRLAAVGADLTEAKKHHDAIEVLALNARLFPRASSAHQRLGEAYAAAGDTTRAIGSYERSLALDPKNDASKAALARLRGKKAP